MAQVYQNKIISKLNILAQKYSLDIFILFGSRAKGTAKISSDYDLAYSKKKPFNIKEKIMFTQEVSLILDNHKFDLIIIDESTPLILKMQIFKEGICIYSKNNKQYQYLKEHTYFDYVDSKTLLEPTKEKFLSQEI